MIRHSREASVTVDAPGDSRKTDWALLAKTSDPEVIRASIAREMHSWAGGLLTLAVLHLIPGTALDPAWGVVLLLMAGMLFYFANTALLAACGLLLAWACIMNLLSGAPLWMGIAALQAYFAFSTFRQLLVFRRAAERAQIGLAAESLHRADVMLPWAGLGITGLAWGGFVVGGILLVQSTTTGGGISDEAVGAFIVGLADLAVFGGGLALSALLARYRFRVISILAACGAVLFVLGFALLAILGTLIA